MACQTPDHPDAGVSYRSLSNFYLADPRRIGSRERDLGLWWRVGRNGPSYRAAWVRDTGELYVARLGFPKEQGEVRLLGQANDEELEEALEGWADVCPQPDSMTWLCHRAASWAEAKTPRTMSPEQRDLALAAPRAKHEMSVLIDSDRPQRMKRPGGAGGEHKARELSVGEAHYPVIATSNTGRSTATVSRRRVNAKLLTVVCATAGFTAPATALLLELSAA
jgi:hypothetical protein